MDSYREPYLFSYHLERSNAIAQEQDSGDIPSLIIETRFNETPTQHCLLAMHSLLYQ